MNACKMCAIIKLEESNTVSTSTGATDVFVLMVGKGHTVNKVKGVKYLLNHIKVYVLCIISFSYEQS